MKAAHSDTPLISLPLTMLAALAVFTLPLIATILLLLLLLFCSLLVLRLSSRNTMTEADCTIQEELLTACPTQGESSISQ